MNKNEALVELNNLLTQCQSLVNSHYGSSDFVQWYFRTTKCLERVFGEVSPFFRGLMTIEWQFQGKMIMQTYDIEAAVAQKKHEHFVRCLEYADGILRSAHHELSTSTIEAVFQGSNSPAESNDLIKIINLAERTLRKSVKNEPTKEIEVQDSFESLLLGAEIEYSREPESIEYSSKKYIPDFGISKINLAIEMKLCKRVGQEKEIIAEINDDILAYKQKYRNILFIVYDLGQIRDADRFGQIFEKNEGVLVRVVKH